MPKFYRARIELLDGAIYKAVVSAPDAGRAFTIATGEAFDGWKFDRYYDGALPYGREAGGSAS